MRPFIPNGVVITTSHVHNMKVRANRIRLEGGTTLNRDEKHNFISNPGLDWTTASAAVGVDTDEGTGGTIAIAMAADSDVTGVTTGEDDNNFPMDDVEDGQDDNNNSPAELNVRALVDFTSGVSDKEMAQKCIELVDAGKGLWTTTGSISCLETSAKFFVPSVMKLGFISRVPRVAQPKHATKPLDWLLDSNDGDHSHIGLARGGRTSKHGPEEVRDI
jgi:hypothetical protein